ncbi:MAG: ABC transporter ATP-binding protein [Clostridiaceae bacterium]
MEMISANNLFFSYGSNIILNNMNFSIKKGTICGILGQNGTGKTTLIKCLNGILKPQNGEVLINNIPISKMSCREIARNISTVPQQTNLVFQYSVLNLVLMGKMANLNFLNTPNKDDEKQVIKILEELNIQHLKYKVFNDLSGGERQLVLIARAIFQNTPIILLDEPTSHLDYKNQVYIMNVIKKIVKNKNITCVVNLHDPNIALNYCDHIIMIKNNKITNNGKTSDIISKLNLSNLYDMEISLCKTEEGRKVVVPF